MENEKTLTGEQSLRLITSMINKAKNDYYDTGLSALLWGSVITVCSLVNLFNELYLHWSALDYIWFLTIAAVIPQIIISVREARQKRLRSREDDFISGIWISFTISIFLFSYIAGVYEIRQEAGIFLTLYGIPTFTSGYGRRFKPMLLGGIACWILAFASLYVPYPFVLLMLCAGGQLAWFIPGLVLRQRYLKAKRQHV